jgi:hypothetical protein
MTTPPSSSKLSTTFFVVGTLAAVELLASSGLAAVREMVGRATSGVDGLSMHSHTNAEAAHITFTNRGATTAWACVKGVVSSSPTGTQVASHIVCTGDVKPHSTIVLDAPYRVGAVLEICNKIGFGDVKLVDWSKCSFDVVDVTSASK